MGQHRKLLGGVNAAHRGAKDVDAAIQLEHLLTRCREASRWTASAYPMTACQESARAVKRPVRSTRSQIADAGIPS